MKLTPLLMTYIKKRATSQGITQTMIANEFNVSLATVKRWYRGIGISLEQANTVCNFLGISLSDALVSIEKNAHSFQYTLKQERYFVKNPKSLAFFDFLLKGRTPYQIKRKYQLSEKVFLEILLDLDKIGLIELHTNDKVKLLVSGEPKWNTDGPLKKAFKDNIFNEFVKKTSALADNFYLYELSSNDIPEIMAKIQELILLCSQANNRSSHYPDETKSHGFYLSLKEFQWSVDQYLKDL